MSNPYPEPTATLKRGNTGNGVKWIQYQLSIMQGGVNLHIDGDFGSATERAVRIFQMSRHLGDDGIVGPLTRAKLKVLTRPSAASCPFAEPTTTLRSGSTGNGVKWVQWQLNRSSPTLWIDGIYGTDTRNAVFFFQTVPHQPPLDADGIVGPATRSALKAWRP